MGQPEPLLPPQSGEGLCSDRAGLPRPPPRALRGEGRALALGSASWSPHPHPMYHRELSPQNLSKQSVNRIFTPFVQHSEKHNKGSRVPVFPGVWCLLPVGPWARGRAVGHPLPGDGKGPGTAALPTVPSRQKQPQAEGRILPLDSLAVWTPERTSTSGLHGLGWRTDGLCHGQGGGQASSGFINEAGVPRGAQSSPLNAFPQFSHPGRAASPGLSSRGLRAAFSPT